MNNLFSKITIEDLPEGALSRYLRDIWNGEGKFEDFKAKWHIEFNKRISLLDISNPVEYNREYICLNLRVRISKRKGMNFYCSFDEGQYGDYGTIPIEKAKRMLKEHGSDFSELEEHDLKHKYIHLDEYMAKYNLPESMRIEYLPDTIT